MKKLLRAFTQNFLDKRQPGTKNYRDPVKLSDIHLRNCKILADRNEILKYMPLKAMVAEVGVLAGDFSEAILNLTQPSQLFLIDTFVSHDWNAHAVQRFNEQGHLSYINNRFRPGIEGNQIKVMQGLSKQSLSTLPDQCLDWIYIDADHRYEAAKADLKEAVRLVKPNGFIVANDYIFFSHHENFSYGVIHAVNEICVEEGFELAYLALHPQMYCDVVLRRIIK